MENEQQKLEKIHEEKLSEDKKKVKKEFSEFWVEAIKFIKELFNIRKFADKEFTRQTILDNIPFRGHTAWLLIFSIMVASVGLNANSTAVVIGAMLISPLMGPIMGAGFAIGTNDIETFRKSAINFFVMVILSIITSYLYFSISPLAYESSELLARTSPTFFDVMIAFFGGLAGIVALTKKGFFNVISGVAIATALMPPLCTAGFGLAIGNMSYFAGALYLLFINSFFISLATFLTIKYLRFPIAKYINSKKRRNISRLIYFLAFLVIIPSILSFIKMYNNEIFQRAAKQFVSTSIKYEGTQTIKYNINPEKKNIEVYLIGELVPKLEISKWQEKLKENPKLNAAKLEVFQSADNSSKIESNISQKIKSDLIEDLFKDNQKALKSKDAEIKVLTNEIVKIKQHMKNQLIPFKEISSEAKTLFPYLHEFSYAPTIGTDFKKFDTINSFLLKWKRRTPWRVRKKQAKVFEKWIKQRLKMDTIRIINLN